MHIHTHANMHTQQARFTITKPLPTFLVLFFCTQECQGLYSFENIFQIIFVNELSSIQSSFEIQITYFTTGYDSVERNRD